MWLGAIIAREKHAFVAENRLNFLRRMLDENKTEILVPKHFFRSGSTVLLGSDHRTNTCDIVLPGMNQVGMSDCAFAITFGKNPLTLMLQRHNSNDVQLRQNGEVILIGKGDKNVPIDDSDSIEFKDFGNYAGCEILFHNAPTAESVERTTTVLTAAEVLQARHRQCRQLV